MNTILNLNKNKLENRLDDLIKLSKKLKIKENLTNQELILLNEYEYDIYVHRLAISSFNELGAK